MLYDASYNENMKSKGLSHESIFVRIAPFSLTSITVI